MRIGEEVSDEELYNYIFHWKYEDNLSWKFCSGILKQNYDVEIDYLNLKKRIEKYLKSVN